VTSSSRAGLHVVRTALDTPGPAQLTRAPARLSALDAGARAGLLIAVPYSSPTYGAEV